MATSPGPQAERAFAAMITRMDKDIGRLMDLLKSLGLEDQTLIIFAGDNGPCNAGGHDGQDFPLDTIPVAKGASLRRRHPRFVSGTVARAYTGRAKRQLSPSLSGTCCPPLQNWLASL